MHALHTRYRLALACALALAAPLTLLADGPASSRAQSQYEVRYMTGMIDHHAMAVHMSEACLANAVHEELQTLCAEMIAAQQQEIMMLQEWLQSWYGITHVPDMTPGMQQQMDRLAQLSGADFEMTFLKTMIRHHWGAVVASSVCVDAAYHPELVNMCADVIEMQVAEITLMRTWLCEWYGLCNYGPKGSVGG